MLSTAVRQEATAIAKQCSASPEKSASVLKILAGLAEARQASVSPDTLRLYSGQLVSFRTEDIQSAARAIATREREEGETAFPELAVLLREVKSRDRRHREDQQRAEKRKHDIVVPASVTLKPVESVSEEKRLSPDPDSVERVSSM